MQVKINDKFTLETKENDHRIHVLRHGVPHGVIESHRDIIISLVDTIYRCKRTLDWVVPDLVERNMQTWQQADPPMSEELTEAVSLMEELKQCLG